METDQKAKAVALLVEGKNQKEVAKEVGVSQPTISRLANQDDIKALIEAVEKRLYSEILDKAVDNDINFINQTHKFLSDPELTPEKIEKALGFLKLGDKKQARVFQGAGIVPTPKGTNINIRTKEANIVFGPAVKAVLDSVVDVEPLPE